MKLRSTTSVGFLMAGAAMMLGALVSGGMVDAASVTGGETITSHNTAGWSTNPGRSCNSGEWHWVISGLQPDPSTADVPATIHVTWTAGAGTDIPLEKVTGTVAHYTYTGHLVDGVVPTGATAVFPGDTTITSYNQFNLSHGPCGTDETTTTLGDEGDTTTTEVDDEGDTTTTEVDDEGDTTTTEVDDDDETTTTYVDSNGPTTTDVDDESGTTTTSVDSEGPVNPTTTVASSAGELPRTGGSGSTAVAIGLMLATLGLVVFGLTRRSAFR